MSPPVSQLVSACQVVVFFTVFTLDGQWRQVVFEKSNKQNTKQPSALLTEKVLRRASLLGTEIAGMLLLDLQANSLCIPQQQTTLQCVSDSWLLARVMTLHLQGCKTESYHLSQNTNKDTGQTDTQSQ